MNLRELDDRLLPAAARFAQRVLPPYSLGRRRRRAAEPTRAAAATPTRGEPTGPAPVIVRLRGIDDRYAARGPLRALREIPQLGALMLAILVLVSGATVFQRARPEEAIDDGATTTVDGGTDGTLEPPDDNRVGPTLGEDVPEYLQRTREELAERAEKDPDTLAWTVVAFDRYFTPFEVSRLMASPRPDFVLFRVPPEKGEQTEPVQARVRQTERDAKAAFVKAARELRVKAAEFDNLARTSENDPAFQAEYTAQAKQARREAAVLAKGDCRCIYGVIVKAPAAVLIRILEYKGIRAVDIGPGGAPLGSLTFRGLYPEEKVTVTGGNEGYAGGNG